MAELAPLRVLIAGGGVAGLEAMLALRRLLEDRVHLEVLAPEQEFTYRQFAVAEPFSLGETARFDLGELIEGAEAVHRHDSLAGLRPSERVATTAAGAEIPYDALVIAIGGRPVSMLPGATTYRGPASNLDLRQALLALDRHESRGLAFAVPATVHWALPIYELALLAAAHLSDIGDEVDLHLVTAEPRPLTPFGPAVGELIESLLAEAGVQLRVGVAPARVDDRGLALVDGELVPCGRVFAMPGLEVEGIEGLPQGPHGFVDADLHMRVAGVPDVYVAGDASWFPIKQGGIATQQADAAAAAIAAAVDPTIDRRPFRPLLRAALLTGSGPLYLRGSTDGSGPLAISEAPLWWPPAKVAGRHLAPYVAARAAETNQPQPVLVDLDPGSADDVDEHRAAVEMALAAAQADADSGDYRGALRWLEVAERLDLTLPPEFALRRDQWRTSAEA